MAPQDQFRPILVSLDKFGRGVERLSQFAQEFRCPSSFLEAGYSHFQTLLEAGCRNVLAALGQLSEGMGMTKCIANLTPRFRVRM